MQRASNHGSKNDALVRAIRNSCYGENAVEIARLFRHMLQSYHTKDTDAGDAMARELSEKVFGSIPTAFKSNMIGTHSVYRVRVRGVDYRCTWRELLAKGSYNHVYYADLTDVTNGNVTTPAVVRVTMETDDLRVYLMENVLHAILCSLPQTAPFVVPIRFPFKIRKSGYPEFTLATCADDLGRGHLGDFLEEKLRNDEQMFALLTQLAACLYTGQRALRFEHRDLKADNIMIAADDPGGVATVEVPELGLSYRYPTLGLRTMLIDFGMTRLELGGEYVACDCMHSRVSFNPCHDLQNFACTLLEDYEDELKKHAPRFHAWLASTCDPLFQKLYKACPDYREASSSKRHRMLMNVCNREKHHAFTPANMLKVLELHWCRRSK
jgi:hypothetical protein